MILNSKIMYVDEGNLHHFCCITTYEILQAALVIVVYDLRVTQSMEE